MFSRVLIAAAGLVIGTWPSAAAAMAVKFSWTGYPACSTASPAFTIEDVPAGTKRLDFKMVDRDVPTYPHGGGSVAYDGGREIRAGAFSYQGPCPPAGQRHGYEWTVRALDENGKAIASATASATFPPL